MEGKEGSAWVSRGAALFRAAMGEAWEPTRLCQVGLRMRAHRLPLEGRPDVPSLGPCVPGPWSSTTVPGKPDRVLVPGERSFRKSGGVPRKNPGGPAPGLQPQTGLQTRPQRAIAPQASPPRVTRHDPSPSWGRREADGTCRNKCQDKRGIISLRCILPLFRHSVQAPSGRAARASPLRSVVRDTESSFGTAATETKLDSGSRTAPRLRRNRGRALPGPWPE